MPRRYRVKKGDSLWSIAYSQYGDPTLWPLIVAANRLRNPALLMVGQSLVIPSRDVRLTHGRAAPAAARAFNVRGPGADEHGLSQRRSLFDSGTDRHARRPAIPVAYPPFRYPLDGLPKITIFQPTATVTIKLTGDVVLRRKGSLEVLELSKKEATLQSEQSLADNEFAKITRTAKVDFDAKKRSLTFAWGIASQFKLNEKTVFTQRVEVVPLTTLRYTYEPGPIEGGSANFTVEGKIGFVVEVTPNPPEPSLSWVQVFSFATLVVLSSVSIKGKPVDDLMPGSFRGGLTFFGAMAALEGYEWLILLLAL